MTGWPLGAAGQAMGCCAAPGDTGAMPSDPGNATLTKLKAHHSTASARQLAPAPAVPVSICLQWEADWIRGYSCTIQEFSSPGSWTAPSITGKSPPSVSNSWHITIHVCKKVQHGNEPSMKLCPAMDLLIPARGRTAGGKSRMSQVRSIRTPNLSDSPLTKYLNKEVKPQPIQEELLSHVCHQSRM